MLGREAERERDAAERAAFEDRLRAKDAEDKVKRHGGKAVAEQHDLSLDAGMDAAGRKQLIGDLRVLSEQAYLEKRQEKQLQVRCICRVDQRRFC